MATLAESRHVQPLHPEGKGFTDEPSPRSRKALPRLRPSSSSSQVTLGEDFCRDQLGHCGEIHPRSRTRLLSAIGFTKREIEAAQHHSAAPWTVEARPTSSEHYAVFDCAIRAPHRQPLLSSEEPHPHDGGGAAFISGASQDHHMPRGDRRGLQGAYFLSWQLALKATRSTATARKLSQPLTRSSSADEDDRGRCRSLHRQVDAARTAALCGKGRGKIVERITVCASARARPRKGYTQEGVVGGTNTPAAPRI